MDELFVGLLDDVRQKVTNGAATEEQVKLALDDLFLALRARKEGSSEEEWQEFVGLCRRHPLREVLHQDPFTCRAFSKPRGYAGDAVLLDYVYGREEQWPVPLTTPAGRRIFDYTTRAPAAEGVLARRGFMAHLVDMLAEERHRPQILSIAAGHLREASLAAAVRRGRMGRFVALDSDVESLREVERCYSCFGVQAVPGNVRTLLASKLELGQFDLIYSTGLFDYLADSTGRRLVLRMFEMLDPGGRLVVANFLPEIRDVGYMEAYMDWKLIYRTRQGMIDLTMEIRQAEIRNIEIRAEENQNIILLQVTRE